MPPPPPMPLSRFNAAPAEPASAVLLRCCGSGRWAACIAACRPYPDMESLLAALDEASYDMTAADLAEALAAESPVVPAPGEGAAHTSSGRRDRSPGRPDQRVHRDQRGVLAAHTALRAAHAAYENRFGHAFLVCLDECAPGEQLDRALAAVRDRLANDVEEERLVVTEELRRLARGRLLRLVRGAGKALPRPSSEGS
ncbi:2-oxo-4-hydroxy-4-carboxy-5-ureidoimidazoline decarboxylase [Streptomyces winkii]|uniref:2-oxo-4-hydroxy-4-carboxy-5-ureidoimidazoline decarboxylase n=1 Tax=Streptomyces winkii TaxID=3051178 RepID=UPI0028D70EE7|nr:2-oxo-4-hydroxy-4-carboxy-5-ureidoimidazoline decarboxylase [Streptomyces sp. DSM 40971]